MKCYLINLERSADRLDWFVSNNAFPNWEIVRVGAVDGTTLEAANRASLLKQKKSDYPMPAGVLGCFLSHRRAWSRMLEAGDEWAFVTEDDAHISKSAMQLFSNSDWLPDDADIVKAETTRGNTEVSADSRPAKGGFRLRNLKAAHRGTAGYFLSRKAAARLLKLTEDYCDPIDEVLFNPELGLTGKLNILQLDPAISVQDVFAKRSSGLQPTIRHSIPKQKNRMPFGPAKIEREFFRVYRKSVRPRLLTWMRKSSFGQIAHADD
ncbi:glycosyltransferase family 25 protein [Hoeflea sp. E7-10]|uniref:Glycosyltransferase family 25 protein n=1 Tax=Hoeflea poritis TaxID=2993659 RepID=A0ABT4VH03_9HYPH|nr:glycosyltransferase family 25 protein [Hoeflea poritis]MDA4843966.1 glycosyltransferase family 25 protein [Hoeflea poritis]